jgi:lipoprotein-anchoring transpeptidase ErfK/SrfK
MAGLDPTTSDAAAASGPAALYMEGGPENPLGARALYLGGTLYRIHGSNEPETIGTAVSSGCIRMLNEDVVDLYDRVKVGTQVVVLR